MHPLGRCSRARRRAPRAHQIAALSARPRWLNSARRALEILSDVGLDFTPGFQPCVFTLPASVSRWKRGRVSCLESRREILPVFRRYICFHIRRRNLAAISRPESRQEILLGIWPASLLARGRFHARFPGLKSSLESSGLRRVRLYKLAWRAGRVSATSSRRSAPRTATAHPERARLPSSISRRRRSARKVYRLNRSLIRNAMFRLQGPKGVSRPAVKHAKGLFCVAVVQLFLQQCTSWT